MISTDGAAAPRSSARESQPASGLAAGHFFLLVTAALGVASVVLARGQSTATLAVLALAVMAAGAASYALYRTILPLVTEGAGEHTVMVAGRTRAALERDKALTLRTIKELEFDHAMGKVADADFDEMRRRLRGRALRLMRQLEGAAAYRAQIEHDLAALESGSQPAPASATPAPGSATSTRPCRACGSANDRDARFCKMCGQPLAAA